MSSEKCIVCKELLGSGLWERFTDGHSCHFECYDPDLEYKCPCLRNKINLILGLTQSGKTNKMIEEIRKTEPDQCCIVYSQNTSSGRYQISSRIKRMRVTYILGSQFQENKDEGIFNNLPDAQHF